MKYQRLGNTGIAVSALGLGTMYFGDETPETEAFEILDAFVEAGGNLIDTADVYANHGAERIVGQWLSARGNEVRSRVVLASKGRFSSEFGSEPDVNGAGLSRLHLHRALDASLKRLKVETIDLYQLHAWDPHTPLEETINFLDTAIRNGKIHYIGLSNFTGWQLQLFVSTMTAMGIQPPASLQQQYSLLSRESEWEVIPAARHNGVGLLPWSPLAGGMLTGKYKRGTTPEPGTRAGSDKDLYQGASAEYAASDRNWATINLVKDIARKLDATPSQVALSWLSVQTGVTASIIGARTVAQLHENLGAVDVNLEPDMVAALEEVSRPDTGAYPYGEFGKTQRNRWLQDGTPAPRGLFEGGSEHPLGKA